MTMPLPVAIQFIGGKPYLHLVSNSMQVPGALELEPQGALEVLTSPSFRVYIDGETTKAALIAFFSQSQSTIYCKILR